MAHGQEYGPQGQRWQPRYYGSAQQEQRSGPSPAVHQNQAAPQGYGQSYPPAAYQHQPMRRYGLTAAQKFWYVLANIPMGAGYFAKIPAKKALADFGMADLTTAEAFWYILMCIGFGAGYFAKLPVAKALSELPQFRR